MEGLDSGGYTIFNRGPKGVFSILISSLGQILRVLALGRVCHEFQGVPIKAPEIHGGPVTLTMVPLTPLISSPAFKYVKYYKPRLISIWLCPCLYKCNIRLYRWRVEKQKLFKTFNIKMIEYKVSLVSITHKKS